MTITAEDLVRREVHYCVSSLVSTLAQGAYTTASHMDGNAQDLAQLCEQALELLSPVDDWEEAGREAGYDGSPGGEQEWCLENDIEPYQREIFEHWIVSDWLAEKLEERGEKVDKDFAGLTIWARTTTGRGIASDSVIEQIAASINAEH